MSSDFVYNSEHNKVMSGGYMVGSGLFKENIDMEHMTNHNSNLAVPIGLLNYRGGGNKTGLFEDRVETEGSGIHSGMIGGSVFDGLIRQLDPEHNGCKKPTTSSRKSKKSSSSANKRTRVTKKSRRG